MMRGIFLARATVTSIFGLRANICASHDPLGAPRRLACWTTALAPMINRRRIVPFTAFRNGTEFLLAAGRFLQRRQSEPGREIAPRRKPLDRWHQRVDCRRGNWPRPVSPSTGVLSGLFLSAG